jgi:hypothetical protein
VDVVRNTGSVVVAGQVGEDIDRATTPVVEVDPAVDHVDGAVRRRDRRIG